jgi:ABC-type bacteriocin/lantibiotic exporter with double-glycine peptidase domain
MTTMNNNSAAEEIFRCLVKIITSMSLILIYARLLFTINSVLILFILLMVLIGFAARKKSILWVSENKNNWTPIDRKLKYIVKISGDYDFAKDIRLFNMSEWFHDIYEALIEIRQNWQQKESRKKLVPDLIECILNLLREGISYGVLLFMMIQGKLSISEFILYFAAIANFSDSLFKITKDMSELRKMSLEISDLRSFYNYPEKQKMTKVFLEKDDFPCAISLFNVKYRYEGAKKETLKGINLEIKAKEKIAIVGLNGAGKTTLIKIICGLLTPTEGSIFISGNDNNHFNRSDYYKLFSVVFQDFAIFPTTIIKTIAQCKDEDIDMERVIDCLKKADLYDYVMSLPDGLHSKLRKEVYHNAVTPSGGLTQRLMLARAIYKDAPIVILDEPTAALDPIAESNTYKHYNEITEGKTAIYISHRLASTQFCDRIILMENGQIAEEGTHEELIQKCGKYYKIYETQSSYYRDKIEEPDFNGGKQYEFAYDKA